MPVPLESPALYAFSLGLVAALNPCGLPLLPAYLAVLTRSDRDHGDGWTRRTTRGLGAGAGMTVGFLATFGSIGIMVENGVRLVLGWIPWAMVLIGGAMIYAGWRLVLGVPARFAVRPPGCLTKAHGMLGAVGFGASYALVSLGCALPLFLAGIVGPITRQDPIVGLITAVAYAMGMGLFVTVACLAVSWAKLSLFRLIRPLSRHVSRLGGVALVAVGIYLVYVWTSDLVVHSIPPGIGVTAENVGASISGWLAGSARLMGVVLGAIVLTAGGLLALRRRSAPTATGHPRTTHDDE